MRCNRALSLLCDYLDVKNRIPHWAWTHAAQTHMGRKVQRFINDRAMNLNTFCNWTPHHTWTHAHTNMERVADHKNTSVFQFVLDQTLHRALIYTTLTCTRMKKIESAKSHQMVVSETDIQSNQIVVEFVYPTLGCWDTRFPPLPFIFFLSPTTTR